MNPPIPTDGPPLVIDPAGAAELLFNTMAVYGPTGSRKTSQIGEFAKYIYEKTGKKTRLISMDGGGWGPIQDKINAGIIDAWRMVEETNPKVALIKASRGGWPEKLVNGLRNGSPLIEIPRGQASKHLKDVGAYAIEGWTSISAAIMRDMVTKGQKSSEDIVSKFTEQLDGSAQSSETFGAPSRSHYGFAQNFTLDYIRNFGALPLERVLYTALEGRGEDKIDKTTKYGPQVAGNAMTASIPAYVGDCLHFEDFMEEVGVDPNNSKQKLREGKVRVWYQAHPDSETGIMWPAKARVVVAKVGEFKKLMGPSGYFVLGDNGEPNLGSYLRVQDEMLSSSSEEVLAWKKMIDEKRRGL